jgi:hypothetical protein
MLACLFGCTQKPSDTRASGAHAPRATQQAVPTADHPTKQPFADARLALAVEHCQQRWLQARAIA